MRVQGAPLGASTVLFPCSDSPRSLAWLLLFFAFLFYAEALGRRHRRSSSAPSRWTYAPMFLDADSPPDMELFPSAIDLLFSAFF